jgi:hypothetical protein
MAQILFTKNELEALAPRKFSVEEWRTLNSLTAAKVAAAPLPPAFSKNDGWMLKTGLTQPENAVMIATGVTNQRPGPISA